MAPRQGRLRLDRFAPYPRNIRWPETPDASGCNSRIGGRSSRCGHSSIGITTLEQGTSLCRDRRRREALRAGVGPSRWAPSAPCPRLGVIVAHVGSPAAGARRGRLPRHRFDRRGHGQSDPPASGNDLDRLSDDLAHVIEDLALIRVKLVDHSMNGAEVVRYDARHGKARIARLAHLHRHLVALRDHAAADLLLRCPQNA